MKYVMLFLVLLSVSVPHAAHAEIDVIGFQQKMDELNRIKPLQNPKLLQSKDVLARTIFGSKSKAVGTVKDIYVFTADKEDEWDAGDVSDLSVVFDRLRLNDTVFLDLHKMTIIPGDDSYGLPFSDEEIKRLYPDLPRTLGDETERLGVKSLLGKPVTSADGTKLGTIGDLLFNGGGKKKAAVKKLLAVYVKVNAGVINDVGVAVPFQAFTFHEYHGRLSASLPNNEAALLLSYVKGKNEF